MKGESERGSERGSEGGSERGFWGKKEPDGDDYIQGMSYQTILHQCLQHALPIIRVSRHGIGIQCRRA